MHPCTHEPMQGPGPSFMTRVRLDQLVVERGLAPSRERARALILAGHVLVDGRPATKAGTAIHADAAIDLVAPDHPYVGRGGLKLAHALDAFAIDVTGRACLDIGASTGGFTEVLLRRGARRVFGVDVGRGQLHQRLASDARVVNLEGVNARDLKAARVSEPVSAITADVSFISLKLALPPALALATDEAWGVFLVKPQFEVGRDHVGKGGIVRDRVVARASADGIAGWLAADMGWAVDGIIDSPIEGGDGNREYLVGARRG